MEDKYFASRKNTANFTKREMPTTLIQGRRNFKNKTMQQEAGFMPERTTIEPGQIKIPKMVEDAMTAVTVPEVQEMIKRLSDYGLGVFFPHMHTEMEGFAPLPSNLVQLEDNLVVSFVARDDERLNSAFPVGWAWDKDRQIVMANCTCGGGAHTGQGWHGK